MRNKYAPTVLTPEQQAEKELTRKRNEWAKISRGAKLEDAKAAAIKVWDEAKVRGARTRDDDYFGSWEVRRAFGIGASLYVRFDTEYSEKAFDPDNDKARAYRQIPKVELNWGTLGAISPSRANAQIALYREMVDIASEIEYVLDELGPIYSIHDLSK